MFVFARSLTKGSPVVCRPRVAATLPSFRVPEASPSVNHICGAAGASASPSPWAVPFHSHGFNLPTTGARSLHVSAASHDDEAKSDQPKGFFARVFSKEAVVASPDFKNRWAMAIPAFATHLCIGSPWAWSVMSGTISRELGFVVSSADDWAMAASTMPLSFIFLLQGVSAFAAGKWQMKVGARTAMTVAALCFGGGLSLGAVGIATHQLWLLYAGYGLLGGCGVGIAYTPPVQALIEWFPDRKGIASGLAIAGFGSGALLFTPAANFLQQQFAKLPEYLGPVDAVKVLTKEGRLFADLNGTLQEVVVANATDLSKLPYDLAEGVYVVGSGATGAAQTLAILGLGYCGIMLTSALTIRRPAPGYKPDGWEPPADDAAAAGPAGNVNLATVMKTPQFYALSAMFLSIAYGGMGLFSVAKPMMNEVFTNTMPSLVTPAFASGFVLALAGGNLGGRLGWAVLSDKIGRDNVFKLFTMGSIPLFLGMPHLVRMVTESGAVLPLYGFIGSTVLAISFMGGVFAILPAYEADLFGSKYVGPIHGKILLSSSGAALLGPASLQFLRSRSESEAITDLLSKVEEDKFVQTFGVGMDKVQDLIDAKTLNIGKLMDIAPAGTLDPTPYIYNTTLYSMAAMAAVGTASQLMIKPVNPKYFEENQAMEGTVIDVPPAAEEGKRPE